MPSPVLSASHARFLQFMDSVLRGPPDITQAALIGRILHFTGTRSRVMFSGLSKQGGWLRSVFLEFLNGACDVPKAARSTRILDFAGTKTGLDFGLDSFRNIGRRALLYVSPNIVACISKAITERYRMSLLFQPYPNFDVRFPEYGTRGKVNDVAIWGTAK
jgi:hypothetical protein